MKRQIFTLIAVITALVLISMLLSSCSRYTNMGYAANAHNSRVRSVR